MKIIFIGSSGDDRRWVSSNSYLQCSCSSEADASELQEHLKDVLPESDNEQFYMERRYDLLWYTIT